MKQLFISYFIYIHTHIYTGTYVHIHMYMCMCVYTHTIIYLFIYLKNLAHMLEVPQSAVSRGRPRRAGRTDSVWCESLRTRRAGGRVPALEQRGPLLQLQQAQRENEFSLSPPFVLFSPSEGGYWPPTLRRIICFTQSTDIHVNFIQKRQR